MNPDVTQTGDALDHRIFRSDAKLTPGEINNLLGIKTVVPQNKAYKAQVRAQETLSQMLKLAVITVMLTAFALIGSMYQLKIGPFYETEAIASTGA